MKPRRIPHPTREEIERSIEIWREIAKAQPEAFAALPGLEAHEQLRQERRMYNAAVRARARRMPK